MSDQVGHQNVGFLMTWIFTIKPRREKPRLRGFQQGPTQTGLYTQRWLETKEDEFFSLYVATTKALIVAQLICVFVFAYAKSGVSGRRGLLHALVRSSVRPSMSDNIGSYSREIFSYR